MVIHYLGSLVDKYEFEGMSKYFQVTPYLSSLEKGTWVLPRYYIQPIYKDPYFEELHAYYKSPVIKADYDYISDLRKWYPGLKEFTPKTWFSHELYKLPLDKKFVVKGTSSSRKDNWNEFMKADSKAEAIEVVCKLFQDTQIQSEDCVVRERLTLKSYGEGINGIPIVREYRIIVCNGKIIWKHYYWTNYPELVKDKKVPTTDPGFRKLVKKIKERANVFWYSMDIAQDTDGRWWLIELNDGSRSGIPTENPEVDYFKFYNNLKKSLIDVI